MVWFSSDQEPSWESTSILLLVGAGYWILVFVVPTLTLLFLHLCRHRKAWERVRKGNKKPEEESILTLIRRLISLSLRT